MDVYRQGDVVIRKVREAPCVNGGCCSTQPAADGRWGNCSVAAGRHSVLAKGERTGHAHRLTEGDWRCNGAGKIVVLTFALIEHEEHSTIRLPAGEYEYYLQRELDPLTLVQRAVYD